MREAFLPTVDVDLDALRANYRFLTSLVAGAECAAVVKCDAYGLGAAATAPALHVEGCRTFFVTYPEEGAALRRALGPRGAEILIFNGPDASSLDMFRSARLTPVLNSLDQARFWAERAPMASAALHIDTGMNRLGAGLDEIEAIAALGPLRVSLAMSHLAAPSEEGGPLCERQRLAFDAAAARFPGARRSLSASGGALMDPRYLYDLIRPGVALYGASPFDRPDARLKPVARLTAPVIQLRDARAGASVGYGGSYVVSRPSRLATVALGYGDGYPRAAGNKGAAHLGGGLCPIAGRVSMDLIVLDATDAGAIKEGDRAEFFGPHLPIEIAAERAGTISYELLTGLGPRIIRRYFAGGRLLSGEAT
jgi:alanine racemase